MPDPCLVGLSLGGRVVDRDKRCQRDAYSGRRLKNDACVGSLKSVAAWALSVRCNSALMRRCDGREVLLLVLDGQADLGHPFA